MKLCDSRFLMSSKERWCYWMVIPLVIVLMVPPISAIKVFLVHGGYVAKSTGSVAKLTELTKNVVSAPVKYMLSDNDIPTLKVDIKYQDWMLLESDRQKALRNGYIADQRHQVKATIDDGHKKYRASVRLQGDMLDHVNGVKRWSLKFELKKKQAIFSAKRFALVSPHVRINQGPSLFAKTLDTAGFDIVSPSYKPVNLIVNGVDWGLMMFEEAFDQSLLSMNNRTEGLILRLDLYDEHKSPAGALVRVVQPRVIQSKVILKNDDLRKQRDIALRLLTEFLSGAKPASDVFDVKKTSQYLATVDVWGAWHALTWNNWRWYYNPHTARLEPIQSDVAVTPAKHIWFMRSPSQSLPISKKMLEDPLVREQYHIALSHLKSLSDSGHLVRTLKKHENAFMSKLHHGAPLVQSFDLQNLDTHIHCVYENFQTEHCQSAKEISSDLHVNADVVKVQPRWDIESELITKGDTPKLVIKNSDKVGLDIIGMTGTTRFGRVDLLDALNESFPQTIPPGKTLEVSLPVGIVAVAVQGGRQNGKVNQYVFENNLQDRWFIPRGVAQDSRVSMYPFINVSDNGWHIQPGTWDVEDYLVTPPNWRVTVAPGAHLRFAKGAGLMVFGQLNAKGTADKPVRFTAQKDNQHWSGLVVFGGMDRSKSLVSHLSIQDATSPKLGMWQPRGATIFINSQLSVRTLHIDRNGSEDALNVINGDVDIDGLKISSALSDGFDCDFCTGSIRNSHFYNVGIRSGGDGIDVSGSRLTISDVSFTKVRDKAVSAGEGSALTVMRAEFNNVGFGVVSKDASTVHARELYARDVKHEYLMSYCKKPIYGPATLIAEDVACALGNCDTRYAAETLSTLKVNGQQVQEEALDVKYLYSTVMKADKPT